MFCNEAKRNIFFAHGAKESINDFGFLRRKRNGNRFALFRFEAKEKFFVRNKRTLDGSGGGGGHRGQDKAHCTSGQLHCMFFYKFNVIWTIFCVGGAGAGDGGIFGIFRSAAHITEKFKSSQHKVHTHT